MSPAHSLTRTVFMKAIEQKATEAAEKLLSGEVHGWPSGAASTGEYDDMKPLLLPYQPPAGDEEFHDILQQLDVVPMLILFLIGLFSGICVGVMF